MASRISALEIKTVAGPVLGISLNKLNDCNLCLYLKLDFCRWKKRKYVSEWMEIKRWKADNKPGEENSSSDH